MALFIIFVWTTVAVVAAAAAVVALGWREVTTGVVVGGLVLIGGQL